MTIAMNITDTGGPETWQLRFCSHLMERRRMHGARGLIIDVLHRDLPVLHVHCSKAVVLFIVLEVQNQCMPTAGLHALPATPKHWPVSRGVCRPFLRSRSATVSQFATCFCMFTHRAETPPPADWYPPPEPEMIASELLCESRLFLIQHILLPVATFCYLAGLNA